MRIMRYNLPLEEYAITNDSSDNDIYGNLEKAPIRITRCVGWNSEFVSTCDELKGIHEEIIAGKTDFILTAVQVNSYSVSLYYQNTETDESGFIFLDGDSVSFLGIEVNRGGEEAPDIYSIDFVPSHRGEQTPRVTEYYGSDERHIVFDRKEDSQWAEITETRR